MMQTTRPRHSVVTRKDDPYIYLYVMGEWYCYRPQDEVGRGAMGIVYRGYKYSNRAVIAVKRVLPQYENIKMIRERARQEASLAFRHPNLVEMIGCCEYAPDHGPIYLLSHFVKGTDIDKYVSTMAGQPGVVEKVASAICSVLDALDYVHSRGVVHRDIKPSNIMIENGSNVRLMDLGISRMTNSGTFSGGGFIGTPEYSAPEQIQSEEHGSTSTINATTDIYELGITFYELITGINPMSCESEADTLTRQIREPLPASPVIPQKLMKVIWKATEKEQAKRYQSALEFKNAIKLALQPDPTPGEMLASWIQEHTLLLAIITVSLALVTFIISIILM